MLLKVTNKCSMGCSHCAEDSTPAGGHMSKETFLKALACARELEPVFLTNIPAVIYLSGGECTEHPDIVEYISEVYKADHIPVLVSNGLFLANKELRESILRPEWINFFIQVTNDSRFYPRKPPRVDDPRICYVDSLQMMMPLGRYVGKTSSLPTRQCPGCFNLRSSVRHYKDIRLAILNLRLTRMSNCTPSISADGSIRAGETGNCFQIGDVNSTLEELTQAILEMKCDKCGLTEGLSVERKRAIGLAP